MAKPKTEMRVVGSHYTKIYASRNRNFSGKLSMKTHISLGSMKEVEESKDTVEVEYIFRVDYSDLGKVEVEGVLYVSTDHKTVKNLIKSAKERDLSDKIYVAITNIIMKKASLKALELEEEFGFPIHIRLPSIEPTEK